VAWKIKREAGADQKTSDLTTVIQEIVDRSGWASGNSLAVIITGSGKRVAESIDGYPAAAPLLHVEYSLGGGLSGTTPPSITSHPSSQAVNEGETASFSLSATGSAPFTYQWQKDGTSISGATAAVYTTPATTSSDNGAVFICVVTNSFGIDTSSGATLTVLPESMPPRKGYRKH